jgi:hypothetical protein
VARDAGIATGRPSAKAWLSGRRRCDCVSALRFAFSDPIVESHLEFSVIGDKRFLKMNLLAAIGESLEM